MIAALDLTARQAARVLAQAARLNARIELEPRPSQCEELLVGHFGGIDGNLFRITLAPGSARKSLAGMVGAFCDVRVALSGQMYMFSTCIVEASDQNQQLHLVAAMPEAVQVANRRRGERKHMDSTIQLQLWAQGVSEPFLCEIMDISADGIGCSGTRRELDEALLVGDEAQVQFELRDSGPYTLNVILCNKLCSGLAADQVIVGMEFKVGEDDQEAHAALERLRAALFDEPLDAGKENEQ